ncbi:hypothetical protein HUN01_27910 [Nostoc edaphicum CCNP1411]|uniref:Uncharacterized protein n=1 Tax=Nostoc edaphicum CCNP1411 TaxID=1472755 RepID=A0A7D7LHZ7_9NOSO|nr:hypothetical protein [Nostoc edaphicum]QMS91231.1 hypothetical protein HUN01_27910 [Nostoc edaphicum CCNP1411]
MSNHIPLLPNKLYKITTTAGESLGDWFYFNETTESHLFHCAAVHGIEMKIQKEAMSGLEITN